MTVVTRKFADITKRPDYYQFEFETGLRRSVDDPDVTITPKRIKAVPVTVDGEAVLSVDLDPGPCRATYRGTTFAITIPESGPADLQELIEQGVIESGVPIIPSNALVLQGSPGAGTKWVEVSAGPPRLWRQQNTQTGEFIGAATDILPDVEAEVTAQVSGQVPAAVTAEVAGRDMLEGSDRRVPQADAGDTVTVEGWRDHSGRKLMRIRNDGAVDIPLPNLAGFSLRSGESPGGYLWTAMKDAKGRLSDLTIGADGLVPLWVLENQRSRQYKDWIVVCGGQSNMAGGDGDPPAGMYTQDPRLVRYDRITGALSPIRENEGALYATLGRALLETAPSNVRVVVVNSAMGGTGFKTSSITPTPAGYGAAIGTWDRTLTSDPVNLYLMMVADTAAVRAKLPLAKFVGLFWSQGESDADMGTTQANGYAAALDDMISAYRTAVGISTLPVVIGSMTPEYGDSNADRRTVQYALTNTPARVLQTGFAFGPRAMMRTDQGAPAIHFSIAAQMDRGRMFVRALSRALWNTTATNPIPPQNLRLTRSGTALTAEWDAPPTRHTSFAVDFTVNAGSSWTAMTKPAGNIGLSATATISASDVVQVRARTANADNGGNTNSPYVYANI